jgi:hypothetical protein
VGAGGIVGAAVVVVGAGGVVGATVVVVGAADVVVGASEVDEPVGTGISVPPDIHELYSTCTAIALGYTL